MARRWSLLRFRRPHMHLLDELASTWARPCRPGHFALDVATRLRHPLPTCGQLSVFLMVRTALGATIIDHAVAPARHTCKDQVTTHEHKSLRLMEKIVHVRRRHIARRAWVSSPVHIWASPAVPRVQCWGLEHRDASQHARFFHSDGGSVSSILNMGEAGGRHARRVCARNIDVQPGQNTCNISSINCTPERGQQRTQ